MDDNAVTPKPTMALIAERAATSVPTVSKVLNGGTDVSEATRIRVMEAAHELGYRRRPRLRPPVEDPRAAQIVDVVVGHLNGSWIGPVLAGIEQEASAAGVDLVLTRSRPDGAWISRLLRRPSLGAIVVLVDVSAAQLHLLTTAELPVVVVDPGTRPPADVASVGSTNWDGGRMAAEHLLEFGHRRIGLIGGTRSALYSSARIDGFTTALREAGVSIPRERLAYCDWSRDSARTAVGAMLAAGAERPTAVFACSDVMGLGAYEAADDAGLRIPDDLSVVGFDDVEESAWATPPMTTVQQRIGEMGATAFRMLHQAHRSATPLASGATATRMELETRLIRRASVAAAPSVVGAV
ncbi:transcriptional regulator, LacI family [Rathayibacter oskolensis]|uniref:Transcriptional regulator, LacI family n=1 Tax=Rathayibacter oskolensis TaxID=1891671 RepID=A0A1X7NXY5_9MICO|nr:LacI family DNA-binding transcriptional regulator [Rathayibacter oskolensis]SMH42659.1 transcriptional regulator, LacI family [Rathayibacter oskolensis]